MPDWRIYRNSHKFGMSIPTGNIKINKLSLNRLRDEQARLQNLKIIFIDEYSMLRQKELFHILEILKQIKGNDLLFGGFCVALVGDPAQIPPVLAESLWVKSLPSTKLENTNGHTIYGQFSDVIILMRLIQKV